MPGDFVCDMVKLDVEGHELHALYGMREIVRRSPECVVIFEKLENDSGVESGLLEYAETVGWGVYAINGISLSRVSLPEFKSARGYFIAALPAHVEKDGLVRNFFDIYPTDFNPVQAKVTDGVMLTDKTESVGHVAFHGPYWFLPRGGYRVVIEGELAGLFQVDVSERFGYKVAELQLKEGETTFEFIAHRDLHAFEFVFRPLTDSSQVSVKKVRVVRI
ncbi:hypothetical protein VL15_02355 [Burkholderia cepacia]|uniref:FkbM family methyltransferase n=2 Tax=Burkholderia cepacia TaxID=292 RepID=A0A0J5XFX2_BURCE|nr:hypothetical protein VL15_02355 [Burkholderia cepacia]